MLHTTRLHNCGAAVKSAGDVSVGVDDLFIWRFSLVHTITYVLFIWKSHEGNF